MEICGHVFAKSQVVGIGPLVIDLRRNQGTLQYAFTLHLKNSSPLIYSLVYEVTPDDINTLGTKLQNYYVQQQAAADEFQAMYYQAKEDIINLIES